MVALRCQSPQNIVRHAVLFTSSDCIVSSVHGCLQVFLAMPSACPVAPDGTKRTVPTGADDRGAVTMYTSDDNAETFKQVSRITCTSRCALSSCQVWKQQWEYTASLCTVTVNSANTCNMTICIHEHLLSPDAGCVCIRRTCWCKDFLT